MLRALTRQFGQSWDAALRFVQRVGLESGARLATRALGEQDSSAPKLADWQLETLASVIERMCHDPAGRLPDPRECGAVEAAAAFVSKMPPERQAQIRQLLVLFEAASLVISCAGERARFSELSAAAQDAYIEDWATSAIPHRRAVFQGLKSVSMMGYWTRPQTWDEIGFSIDGNPGVPAHVASDREVDRDLGEDR